MRCIAGNAPELASNSDTLSGEAGAKSKPNGIRHQHVSGRVVLGTALWALGLGKLASAIILNQIAALPPRTVLPALALAFAF